MAAGRGEQAALVWDSRVTASQRTYTYGQLHGEVARVGGVLRDLGVGAGDTVVPYMPMVREAVTRFLACARVGAVHSVDFGEFAPPGLAMRVDDAQPTVILSAWCGIEASRVVADNPLLEAALAQVALVVLEARQSKECT